MVFPILIVILFTALRNAAKVEKHSEILFEPFESSHDPCQVGYAYNAQTIRKLGYAPNSQFYSDLIKTSLGTKFKVSGFETEDELNQWIRNSSVIEPVAAVNFDISETVSSINNDIMKLINNIFFI